MKYLLLTKFYENSYFEKYYISLKDNERKAIAKLYNKNRYTDVALAQVLEELQSIQQLNHKQIVPIIDIQTYQNTLAFIEEIVSVPCIKFQNNFSLATLLEIFLQLSSLLYDLHLKKITHNALNPFNILYDKEKQKIYLTGFEEARLILNDSELYHNDDELLDYLYFISPEQTKQLEKSADHRSDIYSLGMIMYWLLSSKKFSFAGANAREILHFHLAKSFPPLTQINPEIPIPLANMVHSLIEKDPTNRYQSAHGVYEDLLVCQKQYHSKKTIHPFKLKSKDIATEFQYPDKLFGRKKEINILLEEWNKVKKGNTSFFFITGAPGIGKTALVQDIQIEVLKAGGFFIKGKYDQYKRNIPFSGILEAYKQIMQYILSDSETNVQRWRDKILQALGDNGQVLINVIPELESLIGKQPPVGELGVEATKKRFNLLLSRFAKLFGTQENPVVLFLDDLQWMDEVSLTFMQDLAQDTNLKYYMGIGAFRDNEVDKNHIISRGIREYEDKGYPLNWIHLKNLTVDDIDHLLSTALSLDKEKVQPLSTLIYNKTLGNPFYIKQFVKSLYHYGKIRFQQPIGWTWDIEGIQKTAATENVIDFLLSNIHKLSLPEQQILRIGAVAGSRFSLKTLASVQQKHIKTILNDIKKPVQHCYIFQIQDYFHFHHDKIQEAIYSKITDDDRIELHKKIGNTLISQLNWDNPSNIIFEIANHLNYGIDKIEGEEEQNKLIQINKLAGIMAKKSGALEEALRYFEMARSLLKPDGWETQYSLTFDIFINIAQCELGYLNKARGMALLDEMLEKAKGPMDKANIHKWKSLYYMSINENKKSIDANIEGLKLLGIDLTKNPTKLKLMLLYLKFKINKGFKSIEDFPNLPKLTDETKWMVLDLIANVYPSAQFLSFERFLLITLVGLIYTIKYGLTEYTSLFFSTYGMMISHTTRNYRLAYRYGELIKKINYPPRDHTMIPLISYPYDINLAPLKKLFTEIFSLRIDALNFCIENGIMVYIDFYSVISIYLYRLSEQPLTVIHELYHKYQWLIDKIDNFGVTEPIRNFMQVVTDLTGSTGGLSSKEQIDYSDQAYRTKVFKSQHSQTIASYMACKYQLMIHFQQLDHQIMQNIQEYDDLSSFSIIIMESDLYFYACLIFLRTLPTVSTSKEKRWIKRKIKEYFRWYKHLATQAPTNFRHCYLILEAEIARLKGQIKKALALLDEAIVESYKKKFLESEGLAREFAALIYIEENNREKARDMLLQAMECYSKWGAVKKIKWMQERYNSLLAQPSEIPQHKEPIPVQKNIDMVALLRANQALSSEIDLSSLMRTLMKTINEHIGASKSLLILNIKNQLIIKVISNPDQNILELVSMPLENYQDLSKNIVNYIIRTQSSVVIDNIDYGIFSSCPYLQKNNPGSVMGIPLVLNNRTLGTIYLENKYTPGVFTQAKLEVLNQIAIQAAISLENAILYKDLKERDDQLKKANELLEQRVESRTRKLQEVNAQLKANESKIHSMYHLLEKSHGNLLAILDKQNIGILMIDKQGKTTFVNKKYLTMFGKQESEVLNQNWMQKNSFSKMDNDSIKQQLLLPEKQRDVLSIQIENNGRRYHFDLQIFDDPRNPNEKIIFLYDVTQLYNLKTQLEVKNQFSEIIGKSKAIKKVFKQIKDISSLDCPVLIQGETGTGKELAARAIHYKGIRKDKPFVVVNCAGLTDSILASQLFGHRKGSFTGAHQDQKGYFEAAHTGTIFLDEIGDISPIMQSHLLRILEQKEYIKIGDSLPKTVDVRIIAATNKDLNKEIEQGRFRKDLLYRLKVARINMPPLRERKEDIPLLINHFLTLSKVNNGHSIENISKEAVSRLFEYSWPGNIRELKNAVLYATINTNGKYIKEQDLPPEILIKNARKQIKGVNKQGDEIKPQERQLLIDALRVSEGNRTQAAKILGISRTTLFRRLKKYQLDQYL